MVIFVLFFLLLTVRLYSLDLTFNGIMEDSWIMVTALVSVPDMDEIKNNLETGQKAEINYEFRLYKDTKGFFSFFDDKLIFSKSITFIVYKHLFFNEFVIEAGADNGELFFKDFHEFSGYFFNLRNYRFYKLEKQDLTGYYLLCRVTLIPKKLEPPLHITTLINRIGLTSDWKRRDLQQE